MMYIQSCLTGERHLDDQFISTDYLTSPKPSISADNDSTDGPRSYISKCFVVRYITMQNLSSSVSSRSSNVSFGCDFHNWCSERSAGFHPNVALDVHRGDLFCCDSNNCNSPLSVIPKLPPPQICYKNTHHWGPNMHIGAGTSTLCKEPDSWCIRSRLLDTAQPATVYDCDNQHQCQFFNMTSGSSLVCRNVSTERGKEELCCCSGQSCFGPLPSRSEASAFGAYLPSDGRTSSDDGAGLSTVTVGCIVAFTLLGLVGVAVMVGLMYQRQNHPETSSLTLTYSRIEEDDRSDIIQML